MTIQIISDPSINFVLCQFGINFAVVHVYHFLCSPFSLLRNCVNSLWDGSANQIMTFALIVYLLVEFTKFNRNTAHVIYFLTNIIMTRQCNLLSLL